MGRDAPEQVNQNELARRLGLTTRQVRNLVDAGMPRVSERGKVAYPWLPCLHWYIEYRVRAETKKSSATKENILELQARQLEVNLKISELALGKEQSELVTLDYMEAQLRDLLDALRARCLNLPGKYAVPLVGLRTPADAQAMLETIAAELLQALSESGDEDLAADDEDPDAEAGAA